MWTTRRLTTHTEIQTILESDRLYAAYAIGDLEPGMFEDCTWATAEKGGVPQAIVLHYAGLMPPPLFLMGNGEGLRAILNCQLRPAPVYVTCRPQHLLLVREYYDWPDAVPMWRMVMSSLAPAPEESACIRLDHKHAAELQALYSLGGGFAFSPAQLDTGTFWGLQDAGQIISVAGTHLVSPTYGIGAIGNVFTHPDHRCMGYGAATTSAVVRDLTERGIQDIVLNVSQTNDPAIHVYERLGFQRYCAFLEGPAWQKQAGIER
jgi:ribosomal protein S18 acetylase RimI-like enzyme